MKDSNGVHIRPIAALKRKSDSDVVAAAPMSLKIRPDMPWVPISVRVCILMLGGQPVVSDIVSWGGPHSLLFSYTNLLVSRSLFGIATEAVAA